MRPVQLKQSTPHSTILCACTRSFGQIQANLQTAMSSPTTGSSGSSAATTNTQQANTQTPTDAWNAQSKAMCNEYSSFCPAGALGYDVEDRVLTCFMTGLAPTEAKARYQVFAGNSAAYRPTAYCGMPTQAQQTAAQSAGIAINTKCETDSNAISASCAKFPAPTTHPFTLTRD